MQTIKILSLALVHTPSSRSLIVHDLITTAIAPYVRYGLVVAAALTILRRRDEVQRRPCRSDPISKLIQVDAGGAGLRATTASSASVHVTRDSRHIGRAKRSGRYDRFESLRDGKVPGQGILICMA
jgi:hypothetical protein